MNHDSIINIVLHNGARGSKRKQNRCLLFTYKSSLSTESNKASKDKGFNSIHSNTHTFRNTSAPVMMLSSNVSFRLRGLNRTGTKRKLDCYNVSTHRHSCNRNQVKPQHSIIIALQNSSLKDPVLSMYFIWWQQMYFYKNVSRPQYWNFLSFFMISVLKLP